MRIKLFFLLLIVLFSAKRAYLQPCTTLGQTPETAFPVCGTSVFTQNTVPLCGNTGIPTTCTGGTYQNRNPYWYRFTCYTAGTLGFILDPMNNADDYDWVLFDITNQAPGDVFTVLSLNVAENWSAAPGNTGTSNNLNGLRNCAGGTPNFSTWPTLIVGHEYLLMVSNWSASQQGYTLTFGGGTAVITDPVIPIIQSASANCDGTQVTIRFNKKMRCNSLAANGTDFTIGGATIISASGFGCASAFDMDSAIITLFAPLAPGNHTVTMINGSDGNTLLDNCGTAIALGNSASFTVLAQSPLPMGPVTPPPCAPTTLTLTFTEPINCNSVAANGSDFTITGPSTVTITSVTAVNCTGNGQTNTITLQLASPVLTAGAYQVVAATGSDGNTLTGQCNRQVTAGNTAQFVLPVQPAIFMGNTSIGTCNPSSLTLTFTEPINCNSIAPDGTDFLITGPAPAIITSATPANCNANGQTTTITLQLSQSMVVAGTYDVSAATGSDGNTITGSCGRVVIPGSSSQFNLPNYPPVPMGAATVLSCTPTSITLTFADLVDCNSVAGNGSDFIITGPSAVTVAAASTVTCDGNNQTNTIILQLSGPILVSGTYQVQVTTGGDGNTITSFCRRVLPGSNTSFTLQAPPPIAMGTVTPPPCTPVSISFTIAEPVNCNSIAANGTDFVITGPSPVTVTSATPINCDGNGQTTTITIQFSAAILVTGIYQVQTTIGTDGNSLIGDCNRQVAPGTNSSFTLLPQPPLPMGTVVPPSCSASTIVVNFTEPIGCFSLASDGTDFIITGPSGVVITSVSPICNANPPLNTVTIQLAAPITTSGTYQLQIATGSDGNTLIGDCNRSITVGAQASFIIPDSPPVLMDSIVPPACSPSSLRLILEAPIRCASIAANGSDFTITGASAVTVSGATAICDANGLTTSIDIQLSSPVVVGGNYQLQLIQGSDGNTLLSECNRQTPPASVNFAASDTVSAVFQYQVRYDCETDTLDFAHNGQHNVNQWTWTVNGSQASTLQTFTQLFSASSQNTVQLTVSNGICSDTYSENIVLDNKVTAAFSGPDIICPEDTARFIDGSTGSIDTWQWNFGNSNTSSLQIPPVQTYLLTGVETIYTVSLTVSNSTGCQTTATRPVKVLGGCVIAVPTAFTPNNDGLNDHLYPLNALKAENLDFKVFNRWGQLVFHSREWTKKWDGKIDGVMQSTNVYVWTLNYTHRDTKVKYSLKGMTTLIR